MIFSHYAMLSDAARMGALRAAIEAAVSPGAVALDLGGGTGVLSMMALRAGASKAIIVERSAAINLARELLRANGFDGRAVFIRADWMDAEVPEPADVLIIEALGPFGIDEGILGAVARARRDGLIKPGAPVIPRTLEILVAPVGGEQAGRVVSFWASHPDGFDFAPVFEAAANSQYNLEFRAGDIAAPPAVAASYDFASAPPESFSAAAEFNFSDGEKTVAGFAGWFRAELGGGVFISTGPGDAATHWKQSFFPLRQPFHIMPGDKVELEMKAGGAGGGSVHIHWLAAHTRGGRMLARSNHSTVLAAGGVRDILPEERKPSIG